MRKLIKKILNENELQWIKDVKSNQDIAQEIADETKIDYRGRGKIFTPFLPHHYPTHFSFHFSSYRSHFTKHCNEVYGLNEEEIDYVWKEYKDIIRDKINDHSNLNENESDGLQWIKDVKSNQDIAQEIADETKVDYVRSGYYVNYPYHSNSSISISQNIPSNSFPKHCKEQYGLNDDGDINNVWERYKEIIIDKINDHSNLNENESDDMQWIRDIKPYIPFEEAEVGHHYNVHITNVVGFNIALNDCEESIDTNSVSQVKVLGTSMEQYHSIYCHDNDFIPYWPSMKLSLDLELMDGNGKRLLRHWFASGDLIQLQEQ